jgi:hypothetical protein
MSVCYSCDAILNKANSSFEHIIPNSIGGKVKSVRLLCKSCNTGYGLAIDSAIAADFKNLVAFLNLERDRNKSYIIKNTKDRNGHLYHLEEGRIPVPVKPSIKVDNGQLSIIGRDRKQVIQIASGLKRKDSEIDLAEVERNFSDEDMFIQSGLVIDLSVGSEAFMRALAKIAVNYYLMKTRGGHHLTRIIDIIKGIEGKGHDIHQYHLPGVTWQEGEVSHVIIVKGDVFSKRLYAQVVLFNTYYYVVNLCDDYDGEEVDYFYRYDVLEKKDVRERLLIPYDHDTFLDKTCNSPEELNRLVAASVEHNLARILQLAEPYQTKQTLKGVVSRTFDKSIGKYPSGTVITQDVSNDVHGKVFAKVAGFLRHIRRTIFE